jgi:hypothetical protein
MVLGIGDDGYNESEDSLDRRIQLYTLMNTFMCLEL